MRLIPRLRPGCLISLAAFILLIFFLEESLIGLVQSLFARSNFSSLEKRIEADGQVRLADLQDDWDLVCLATPYCSGSIPGAPDGGTKACHMTANDGLYALSYYNADELVHIEDLASGTRMSISKPCLLLTDDPVISADGDEFRIQPRSTP